MRRWLGLSVTFHALLLVGCLLVSRSAVRPSPELSATPITVERLAVERHARERPSGGPRSHSPRPGSRRWSLDLSALGLRYSLHGTSPEPTESSSLSPGHALGAGAVLGESANASLYQYLYERIDANLTYPSELKQLGLEGTVTATLSFSRTGAWLKDQSTDEAPSPFLRVVVRRAIREALAQPIPVSLRSAHGAFTLRCQFIFEITEHDSAALKASRRLVSGSSFSFYRNWQHSKLSWDLGPFHGLAPVPFVGFSPGELVDWVASAFSKKSKVDPLQNFRDDPDW